MRRELEIKRVYAQPNGHTFLIRPIAELIKKYMNAPERWIDPCAGFNSPAGVTNDLNPDCPTTYHLHAFDFAEMLEGQYEGVLFDPPYSLRQMKELYNSLGMEKLRGRDTTNFYGDLRRILTPKIMLRGYVISCGWNSIGFGKKHGFAAIEILLVCHGRAHNDTIVTVERKNHEQGILG